MVMVVISVIEKLLQNPRGVQCCQPWVAMVTASPTHDFFFLWLITRTTQNSLPLYFFMNTKPVKAGIHNQEYIKFEQVKIGKCRMVSRF